MNIDLRERILGAAGMVMTEEQRRQMRSSSKVRWARPEEHEALSAYFASMTEEAKAARSQKISEKVRAAMADPSVKEKISRALTGTTHDEARREITSRTVKLAYQNDPTIGQRAAASRAAKGHQPMLGKHHSEETKVKFRLRRATPESRAKMSAAQKGRKHTPETIAKMVASHARRREAAQDYV